MKMKIYGIKPVELGLNVVHLMSDYCLCTCEFHDDKKPSMAFYYENGNFYCFACGEYGDINKLVKKTGGYVVKGTIEVHGKNDDLKNHWFELTKLNVNPSDSYLLERGVTPEQIVKFNIKSDSEKVVVPFYTNNEITGVKMRWKQPNGLNKYMNFGKQPLLFGDNNFVKNDVVLVIEGVFGYFFANKYNIKCVSTLSANRVTGVNEVFSNYSDTQFRIMFDPDNAGYFGASKLLFLNRMNNNVFGLLEFKDIDLMSKEYFDEVLKTCKITKSYIAYDEKYDTIKNKQFYTNALKKYIKYNIK